MQSFLPLRARLQAESGFSLVELIITMVVMGIVMTGLVNIFTSGERASADATARMQSQQGVRVAFDRLEYDTRCASTAGILSSGAGVHLNLGSWCDHATGDVSWCVSSGSLVRLSGTTCSGSTQTYVTNVTSATPFSCYSPVSGATPQLKVVLTINPATRTSDQTTATDYITMRNASSSGCA
jgi:prepilin-type N-terminal cleavage/methylation domain-containing protein